MAEIGFILEEDRKTSIAEDRQPDITDQEFDAQDPGGVQVFFDRMNTAIAFVESSGDPQALSPKGAFGLMQVLPSTAADPGFGVEPLSLEETSKPPNERDPVLWADLGQRYFKALFDVYGDLDTALIAYNWGPGNVDKWILGGASQDALDQEPRNYVRKVRRSLAEPEIAIASIHGRDPNKEAAVARIAKSLGIPTDVVREDTQFADKQQKLQEAEKVKLTALATARILADPVSAQQSIDDIPAMVRVEEKARNATFWESASSSVDTVQGFFFNVAEVAGQVTGIEFLEKFGKEGSERNLKAATEAVKGLKQQRFTQLKTLDDLRMWAVQNAGSQSVMWTPALLGSMLGAGAGMLGGPFAPISVPVGAAVGGFIMSFMMGVGETQQAIEERGGKAPLFALGGGALIGALDSILPGKVGARLVSAFGREAAEKVVKSVALKLAKQTGKEMTLEGVTESIQEAISEGAAAVGTGTKVNTADLADRMVEAFAIGAFFGGSVSAVSGTTSELIKAARSKTRMDDLHQAAKDTKINERNPDLAAEHREEVLNESGVEEVHVNAEALINAVAADPSLDTAETLVNLGVIEDLELAVRENRSVAIPADKFATQILGQPIYDGVTLHMKFTAKAKTATEAAAPLGEPDMQAALSKELISYSASQELAERVQKLIEGFAKGEPVNVLEAAKTDEQAILLDLIRRVESRQGDIVGVEVASRVRALDDEVAGIDTLTASLEGQIEERAAQDKPVKALEKRLEKLLDRREAAIREQITLEEPGIVQQKVRRITGQALDAQTKVTTRAGTLQKLNVEANIRSVRAARQGFSKGFSTGVKTVQEAKGFLIDALAKAGVPLDKFKGFLKNIKSLEQLQKKRIAIQQRMNRLLDATRKRQLTEAMAKVFKSYKVKRQSGKPVGKLTADGQEIVDRLAAAFSTTREAAAAAIESKVDTLGSGDTIEGALDPASELELLILALKADTALFSADAVENLLVDLEGIIEGEKAIRAQSLLGQAVRVQETQNEVVNQFLPPGEIQTREPGFVKRSLQAVGVFGWNGVWRQKIRALSMSSDKVATDKLSDDTLSLYKENQVYRRGLRERTDAMMESLQKRLGIDRKALNKRIHNDTHNVIDLGKSVLATGQVKDLQFTRSEMRYIEMINRHPALREVIQDKESNGFTEEILKKVSDALDTQDSLIIDEMILFYDDYYNSINDVYRELYGVNLPKEEFYFPTSRVSGKADQASEFLQGSMVSFRGGVTGRALKSRVANTNPFGIQGDFQVFDAHLNEMEYFKAYANKVRFLNSVFDGKIMQQIGARRGKQVVKSLKADLEAFAKRGVVQTELGMGFVRRMMRNFAGAQLGLKIQIGLKQMLSQFIFVEDISTTAFAKGMAQFYANPKKAWKFLNDNSDFFKDRGMGIDVDFQDFLNDPGFFKGRGVAFKKHLFLAIQFGDKFAIAAGGFARYRAQRAAGMGHKAAMANFEQMAERTQQSPSVDQQSTLQRSPWGRLFTMFMTSHNAIARAEAEAIREFRKGRIQKGEFTKRILVTHFLIPQLMMFAANGFHWDEEDQLFAGLTGSLTGFFIIGEIAEQFLISGMTFAGFDKQMWDSPAFNPMFVFAELAAGLNELGKQGIEWIDFVDGTKSIDSILKAAGGFLGINLAQMGTMLRGAYGIATDPQADKTKIAFEAIGGYSPWVVQNKVLENPYSEE